MENFIDRLEKKLDEKKITKTELATDLGIRRPTLSEWKKNGAIPAGDVCLKIANYLGVSVEWLITGKEKEEAKTEKASVSKKEQVQKKLNALTQDFFNSLQEIIKEM